MQLLVSSIAATTTFAMPYIKNRCIYTETEYISTLVRSFPQKTKWQQRRSGGNNNNDNAGE